MQLRSDVQMLHLQARETARLPTHSPPNSSFGASEPDLLSTQCRPPFSSTAGPSARKPRPPETRSNGSPLPLQMWKRSSVNTLHWLICKIHTTLLLTEEAKWLSVNGRKTMDARMVRERTRYSAKDFERGTLPFMWGSATHTNDDK